MAPTLAGIGHEDSFFDDGFSLCALDSHIVSAVMWSGRRKQKHDPPLRGHTSHSTHPSAACRPPGIDRPRALPSAPIRAQGRDSRPDFLPLPLLPTRLSACLESFQFRFLLVLVVWWFQPCLGRMAVARADTCGISILRYRWPHITHFEMGSLVEFGCVSMVSAHSLPNSLAVGTLRWPRQDCMELITENRKLYFRGETAVDTHDWVRPHSLPYRTKRRATPPYWRSWGRRGGTVGPRWYWGKERACQPAPTFHRPFATPLDSPLQVVALNNKIAQLIYLRKVQQQRRRPHHGVAAFFRALQVALTQAPRVPAHAVLHTIVCWLSSFIRLLASML